MAHSLDMKVVAEGVETEEQAAFLRSIHVDEFQGYLYGRPMPSTEIPKARTLVSKKSLDDMPIAKEPTNAWSEINKMNSRDTQL